MILMGAGASFGSKDVNPKPPPLGRMLFSELEELGGIAASMPLELKALFLENFEVGMAAYINHAEEDVMGFQRELARYLATFQPGMFNVYRHLINELGDNVIYSTLNYDLLFEESAAWLDLDTVYTLTKHENCVRLLKIHGSCNFWPDITTGTFRNVKIKNSVGSDVEAPVRPLNRLDTINKCLLEDSLAPAIALYTEGKAVKVSPSYVNDQLRQWEHAIASASQIFLIGVRVHLADKHIWERFGKSQAEVFYFGLDSDRKEFDEWNESNTKDNIHFVESDFFGSVSIIKKYVFSLGAEN